MKKSNFSLNEIKECIKENFPLLDEKEINYHAYHVQDYDILYVSNDYDVLMSIVFEQIKG